MTILVIAAALVYLIGVIRAKEIVTTVIALVGIVLAVLGWFGVVRVNLG